MKNAQVHIKNIQAVNKAENRLDQLFIECGWSADHPAMLDWATIKFALQDARQNSKSCTGCMYSQFRSDKCDECNRQESLSQAREDMYCSGL